MNTKLLSFLCLFLFLLLGFSSTRNTYAQQEDPNNPRTWNYFKILARAEDDSIFVICQDDMGIDPKLESYTLVVKDLHGLSYRKKFRTD